MKAWRVPSRCISTPLTLANPPVCFCPSSTQSGQAVDVEEDDSAPDPFGPSAAAAARGWNAGSAASAADCFALSAPAAFSALRRAYETSEEYIKIVG